MSRLSRGKQMLRQVMSQKIEPGKIVPLDSTKAKGAVMNTQEAKFILQAYRPGGEDAGDPQFAEALAQAKLDPELAKWFAEQLAFDAAASRALKEVKAPAALAGIHPGRKARD